MKEISERLGNWPVKPSSCRNYYTERSESTCASSKKYTTFYTHGLLLEIKKKNNKKNDTRTHTLHTNFTSVFGEAQGCKVLPNQCYKHRQKLMIF